MKYSLLGIIILILSFTTLANFGTAKAHPGGLNSEGCHTNRKTGEYHCHRKTEDARKVSPNKYQANKSSMPLNNLTSQKPNSKDPYFRNCSEARMAGMARIKIGQPGYAPHLDRDNDGIACE